MQGSVVFEQSYGGVEGDSASVAELSALMSSLSGVPIKQNLAVTGSINQHGRVQVVGGINEKIEGFFKVCKARELDGTHRVVIAVTERSSLSPLWRAAMDLIRESPAELVALFVDDDRWRRAASLSITREIWRISGAIADFTAQRAEQLNRESIVRVEERIKKSASQSDLSLAFEVLAESNRKRIGELIGAGLAVLNAPSFMATRPIYAHLTSLQCRILLVDATEEDAEDD